MSSGKSMTELDNPAEELELFLDNLPTVRCGEGGCYSCDAAYQCTVNEVATGDAGVRYDRDSTPEWDSGDTFPGIPELLWDELGGEG